MNAFRTRLGLDRSSSDDTGLTMAEVIVALFVFTIFILGLGYSLLSMTRLVADDENRLVAASLASQELDRVRAIPDAFNVYSSTTTQTVNGITYTISRDAGWVSTNGSTASCGGGGGNLQYKAVDVQVTWPNQYVISNPVRSSAILAPATRINDPSYGTIIVSVLGADGTGRPGVGVTVTPVSGGGGVAVGSVPATDSQGCSYVLKVTPGTYTVALSKTAYIDYHQITAPSTTVTIAAGSSQIANFAYDAQATFNVKYASNYAGAGTVKLPTSLTTNFMTSAGVSATSTTSAATQYLYPVSEGYGTIAGNYSSTSTSTTGCLSVDPVNWAAGVVNGTSLQAGTRPQTGVAPGTSGAIGVRMGVIAATWPAIGANSITVKSAAAPTGLGDPGCATATSYSYSFSTVPAAGTVIYLAVPFGSWNVYTGLGAVLTLLPSASTTAATQGEVTGTTVTLDPRTP